MWPAGWVPCTGSLQDTQDRRHLQADLDATQPLPTFSQGLCLPATHGFAPVPTSHTHRVGVSQTSGPAPAADPRQGPGEAALQRQG